MVCQALGASKRDSDSAFNSKLKNRKNRFLGEIGFFSNWIILFDLLPTI
jgi:hypothetical protein